MSIQRYDEFDEGGLREADKGEYVNYWDHCNKMTDTFAAKMRLAQQVDDHKAALADKAAELESMRKTLEEVGDLVHCGDHEATIVAQLQRLYEDIESILSPVTGEGE